MSVVSAYEWEKYYDSNFTEMNGTIVDKDVAGIAIDYLIDINGTKCYLSCFYQPYEEYYIGDEVTMNGTIEDEEGHTETMNALDFDGKYDGQKMPRIRLNLLGIDSKDWGQMRLTSDMDNQYYFNVEDYPD